MNKTKLSKHEMILEKYRGIMGKTEYRGQTSKV